MIDCMTFEVPIVILSLVGDVFFEMLALESFSVPE